MARRKKDNVKVKVELIKKSSIGNKLSIKKMSEKEQGLYINENTFESKKEKKEQVLAQASREQVLNML